MVTEEAAQNAVIFGYFMIYYGIVLGIAVTELFGGIGRILRHRISLRAAALTLSFCFVVFLETATNFIDAWDRPEQAYIDLVYLGTYTAIGGVCVILASLVVPPEPLSDSLLDVSFGKRRKLFGVLLIASGLLIILADIRSLETCELAGRTGASAIWLAGNLGLFAGYASLYYGKTKRSAYIAMLLITSFYAIFYIDDPTDCFDASAPGWFGLRL